MTPAMLMYGDTERSSDMFRAVPLGIVDPFLYAEVDGRKVAVISVLERDRVLGLDAGIEVLDPKAFGREELMKSGMAREEADLEVALRACRELGIERAAVPPTFPLALADRLRASGMEIGVDAERFGRLRRTKSDRELAGLRRAQAAAEAAMSEAARLLRELPEGLTCERVRAAMQDVCRSQDCDLGDEVIVARNEQSALGHESGSGPIGRGDIVLIDIWPRDKESRCWADMTRTFVAGGEAPPDELLEYWRLTKAALDAVLPEIRPGASCRALYDRACDVFEAAGQPTLRSQPPGSPPLDSGFFHGLGHGVGLDIHEPPGLGLAGDTLVAGDVVTVEPGCYRPGFGGCRLEDLVLVTGTGAEVLTQYPYDLAP